MQRVLSVSHSNTSGAANSSALSFQDYHNLNIHSFSWVSLIVPLSITKTSKWWKRCLVLTVFFPVPQVILVISSCNLTEIRFSKSECHEHSSATLTEQHTGTIFLLAPIDLCNVINHCTIIVHF